MDQYTLAVMTFTGFVSLLLALGTSCICGTAVAPIRAVMAAILWALYSAACLLPGFHFLGNGLWRCVCLLLVAVAAFGMERQALTQIILYSLLHLAFHGLMQNGLSRLWSVIMSAAVFCLVYFTGEGNASGKKWLPVSITYGQHTANLTALLDTGNTLRDPVTGASVLVVSPTVGYQLLGLTPGQIASPVETMAQLRIPGLRLIPYHSIGQPGGLLLAMHFSDVQIGKTRGDHVVAFAPQAIGDSHTFQALAGGTV